MTIGVMIRRHALIGSISDTPKTFPRCACTTALIGIGVIPPWTCVDRYKGFRSRTRSRLEDDPV